MSRLVSALRRAAGSELAQDICALLATGGFILVGYYASAFAAMSVLEWRAGL